MCFSPEASFTAGVVLSAAGLYAMRQTKRRSALLFAAIPLVFGLQQLAEGVVWITFGQGQLHACATTTYLVFAKAAWPLLVPLAVYFLETNFKRRKLILPLVVLGAATSAYLLWHVLRYPFTAHIVGPGLGYYASEPYPFTPAPFYFLATSFALLLSSRKVVNALGIATFVAAAIAAYLYTQSFLSTWCFFSALLSIFVLVQVRRESGKGK
ncbi:MAG TPA: DUF6629 family protein [Verrucomicrobiae bacterium]|nr:DUF6629 family protein [Verrucomicrobiae bacterium]